MVQSLSAGGASGFRHMKTLDLMDIIASSTLEKIEQGNYNIDGKTYSLLRTVQEVKDKTLCREFWFVQDYIDSEVTKRSVVRTTISESERLTLADSRALNEELTAAHGSKGRISVLNFASAKNPGGFLTGAQAQVS